jgi:hypothetical protein
MSKDKTVDYLYNTVGTKLNLKRDEFYLKRPLMQNTFLKFYTTTLAHQGFTNGVRIKAFKGEPEEEGIISIELKYVRLI